MNHYIVTKNYLFFGKNIYLAVFRISFFPDSYTKYAQRTIETIALQDLMSLGGREKCKEFIEITDANYVPTAQAASFSEETITDVVLVDGKIIVSTPTIGTTKRYVSIATLLTLTTEHRGRWHRPRYK
jgi:hypothetical protein